MTTYFHRHVDLRLTALQDEGVVLHLGERKYFTVNSTGMTILEALRSPKSLEEIVDAVAAEYEVERAQATVSARAFLDRCLEAALIIERPA